MCKEYAELLGEFDKERLVAMIVDLKFKRKCGNCEFFDGTWRLEGCPLTMADAKDVGASFSCNSWEGKN